MSALLDGRLPAAEEERCWQHVQECHGCRDLVEREGWVKTQLAQLSLGQASAPDSLKSSLRAAELAGAGALTPTPFPTAPRGLSRGLVAIGGSAAGACVIGVLALGMSGPTRVDPRPPVTDISRPAGPTAPSVPATPATPLVPALSGTDKRRRTLPRSGSRTPLAERVAVIREKMVP